jgi:phosphoribosyl-ATP pyrophosphohydrolase/phosphoribosyl-AMP cyclohydrolase/histidinol dehydrogenase
MGTQTCWGNTRGLPALACRITAQATSATPGSYSYRLLSDAALLRSKLTEEAGELAAAASFPDVAHEAADVLYFTMVAMQRAGVTLADVAAELDRRALKVTRRPGNAKPQGGEETSR